VARKPGHRGEHEASRKTTAQGKPELLRLTCGPTPVLFVARGPRVQPAPGFPCALSIERGSTRQRPRGILCRGNADSHPLFDNRIRKLPRGGIGAPVSAVGGLRFANSPCALRPRCSSDTPFAAGIPAYHGAADRRWHPASSRHQAISISSERHTSPEGGRGFASRSS
jgi:hypothetical protein